MNTFSRPSGTIRERSGEVGTYDPLVVFLYHLMRDHLPTGDVEGIMREVETVRGKESLFSNGWLAEYAGDIAQRLEGSL